MAAPTEQEFSGHPESPAAARHFAVSALAQLVPAPVPDELREDVELVVSELVTNAVRAGSPTVRVAVGVSMDAGMRRVVLRVSDEASGWPEARDAGIHDTGGRGLPLISAVSASWGVRMAETGKVVWAELDLPAPSRPDLTPAD